MVCVEPVFNKQSFKKLLLNCSSRLQEQLNGKQHINRQTKCGHPMELKVSWYDCSHQGSFYANSFSSVCHQPTLKIIPKPTRTTRMSVKPHYFILWCFIWKQSERLKWKHGWVTPVKTVEILAHSLKFIYQHSWKCTKALFLGFSWNSKYILVIYILVYKVHIY